MSTIPIGAAYLVLRTRRMTDGYHAKRRVASGSVSKLLCFGPAPSALALPVLCEITPRVHDALCFQYYQIIMLGKCSTNVGPCQASFSLKRIIKGVPITTPIVLGALVYGT